MISDKNESSKNQHKQNNLKLIWGIALILAGLGVFYRIPQVMPKIQSFTQFSSSIWFIRFCFYFMGIIIILWILVELLSSFWGPHHSATRLALTRRVEAGRRSKRTEESQSGVGWDSSPHLWRGSEWRGAVRALAIAKNKKGKSIHGKPGSHIRFRPG